MPEITDIADFTAKHRKIKVDVGRYLEMDKSNYQKLDQHTKAQLDRSQEKYFHAINFESRIRFAKMVLEHVFTYVDGADSDIDLHEVTFIPNVFITSEADAADFDVEVLQSWIGEVLDGHDFIGMVEAAYFPAWLNGQPTIAWHGHVLTIKSPRHQLDRAVAKVKSQNRSLVEGIDPVYIAKVTRAKLEGKICYFLKSPLTSYRPGPLTVPLKDNETGKVTRLNTGRWKVSKPPLRTGEHIRMCKVLRNQQLDRLLFGGGKGAALVTTIRRKAFPSEWSE